MLVAADCSREVGQQPSASTAWHSACLLGSRRITELVHQGRSLAFRQNRHLWRYSSTLRASSVRFAPLRCMLTSGSCMVLCWLGCGQRSRPSTPSSPSAAHNKMPCTQ